MIPSPVVVTKTSAYKPYENDPDSRIAAGMSDMPQYDFLRGLKNNASHSHSA